MDAVLRRFYLGGMETAPYRHRVVPGYSDTFIDGYCTPVALMTHLEEAAAEHCRHAGKDVFSLWDEGYGWVLTAGSLRVYRYPLYREPFVIETWISLARSVWGLREYRIVTHTGEVLAEAGGRWIFMDVATHKPAPVPDAFWKRWHRRGDSPYGRGFETVTPPAPSEGEKTPVKGPRFNVRRMDVDANRHLHNTRYLEWLLNAVPDELFTRQRPISLGVKFRHEVKGGDSLVISSRLREDGVWLHEAGRDSDGEVVATGFSVWGPPQSGGIITAA